MVAPRMIAADASARPGRLQRATEVRQRERRDLPIESELHRGVVERLDRLATCVSRFVCVLDLTLMRVEATELTEEDLPVESELPATSS